MRCSNWILTRHLIHELNEKYFGRRKNQCVIYIQTETLSATCSNSKWTNLPRYLKLKPKTHVKPFSNSAPPHWALTCAIIQGGMDSNCPLMKVAQALSREGDCRQRMTNPSRVAAACEEKRGSKRNKEILLEPEGESRATVLEQRGAMRMLTRSRLLWLLHGWGDGSCTFIIRHLWNN